MELSLEEQGLNPIFPVDFYGCWQSCSVSDWRSTALVLELQPSVKIRYIVGTISVLALLSFWVMLRRSPSPSALSEKKYLERREKQIQRLSDWKTSTRIPVRSKSEVLRAVANSSTVGLRFPKRATAVEVTALTPDVVGSLNEAIAGLVVAYGNDSGEAVWEYMSSHAELLSDDAIKELFRMTHGSESAVGSPPMSKETFTEHWRKYKKSNWESILPDTISRKCWRITFPPDDELKQFEPDDTGEVFMNITKFRHFFSSKNSIESILDQNKHVLFADCRFVIELNRSAKSGQIPYFVRFWHEPTQNIWHAWMLGCHATGGQSNTPNIAF